MKGEIEAVAAQRGAHHLHGLAEAAPHGEQVDLQGRDRGLVLGPARASVQVTELLLRGLGSAREERRPRRLEVERERELVVRLPAIGRQALDAGAQVRPGARVGRRRHRLARCPQRELDERDPFGARDQGAPLYQLIDDLEDPVPQLLGRRPRQHQPPDAEVQGRPLALRHQCVRRLLDAIVGEAIAPLPQGEAQQPLLDRREEIALDRCFVQA